MFIETIEGRIVLPDSTRSLTRQAKYFRHVQGTEALVVQVSYDDTLKNGHNTLSIVADLYESRIGKSLKTVSSVTWTENSYGAPSPVGCLHIAGGQLHDEVRSRIPSLQYVLPYHLVSTIGPMHYIANTVYHAKDKIAEGRHLAYARDCAVWPTATDEELCLPSEELTKLLLNRLPQLMADFKSVVERAGFIY